MQSRQKKREDFEHPRKEEEQKEQKRKNNEKMTQNERI